MANQAAPLRDFTLGTPASRIIMTGLIAPYQEQTNLIQVSETGPNVPAPKGSTLSSGGGGGGGVVTYSTPITG